MRWSWSTKTRTTDPRRPKPRPKTRRARRTAGGRRLFGGWTAPGAAALGGLLLSGCATIEQQGSPPAPKTRAVALAAPRTVGVDRLSDAEHGKLVDQFGGEYHWPAAENYLNAILVKLAAASGPDDRTVYRVTLLNSPVVNAFALPSGNLYVSRGLLALAEDSAEIAAVMAHEIGHVTARHAAARAEREKRAALIAEAAAVIQNRQKGEEVEASQKLSFASFSRQQEIDADKIGVTVIARAGYDPYGAARFLTALGRSIALRDSILGQKTDGAPNILATHPSTPERIAQATAAAREFGAPGVGVADRGGYLAAIAGVAFGEDASRGVARGRVYVNPRQGVALTAPGGFALETNAGRALLGRAEGGKEALRLDSIAVSPTVSLETYLASGWLDGLLQSSIRVDEIGGMPAVLGVARAGEWNFRVALVRRDALVYRLIFAARTLDESTEARFLESIRSFRPAAESDLALARQLKLGIATAGDGDDVRGFARRMAVFDRPEETFRVLNGLGENDALKSGVTYKLVE